MSRSLWRCRNPDCPTRGGTVLGRVTADEGLVLDPAVRAFAVYFDTHRVTVTCPACDMSREFYGSSVRLSRENT